MTTQPLSQRIKHHLHGAQAAEDPADTEELDAVYFNDGDYLGHGDRYRERKGIIKIEEGD